MHMAPDEIEIKRVLHGATCGCDGAQKSIRRAVELMPGQVYNIDAGKTEMHYINEMRQEEAI